MKTDKIDWFDAEKETSNGGRTTTVRGENVLTLDGRTMRARTTGKDDRIAELTARYKFFRGAAEFAPADDRANRIRQRDIAYAEMQIERFAQQLEKYRARPDARPEQVAHYEERLDMMRGRWMR